MYVTRILVVIAVTFNLLGHAQISSRPDSLSKFGIYEYPSNEEVLHNRFATGYVGLSKVPVEDISPDFDNIESLRWMESIAKQNKVIAIGETHYSTFIHNIRNRLVFALNTFDKYPFIILEQQYSFTPFVNHYVHIKDDKRAREFFDKALNPIVRNVDDSLLYENIRRWNSGHDNKQISIGFSDMEWNTKFTIGTILKNYFSKLPTSDLSVDSFFNLDLSRDLISKLRGLLERARKNRLVGEYSFVTAEYVENVVDNLESTLFSMMYSWEYYRQKGIIRNLTNDRFFGKEIKTGKVVLHGGGEHMASKFKYPDGANFFAEGSYLANDFPATKGKTYSIMLEGMAFQLGKLSSIDISKSFAGDQYKSIVKRMKKAYAAGLLKSDKPYFTFDTKNDFTDMVIANAYQMNATALRLVSLNKKSLLDKLSDSPEAYVKLKDKLDEIENYNCYIFITSSPLDIVRINRYQ